MSLLLSLAGLIGVAISALLFAGIGRLFLRGIRYTSASWLESLLLSVALGAIASLLFVSAGETWREPVAGVRSAIVLAAAIGLVGIRGVLGELRGAWQNGANLSKTGRLWAATVAAVLLLEGFAAMAPLTGSDALHYHFTAQELILRKGFHANYFLSSSFLLGLSHQLILAALALGSEKLALGWIFLGGTGAALAIVLLTRHWVCGAWPWIAALAFLLTPVVFWQATTAGAPDIWMAFFVSVGALAVGKSGEQAAWKTAIVAGALAGAAAGGKYTGLIFAAVLFAAFVRNARNCGASALFFATAVFVGAWSYLRNFVWTGDPVFPYLQPFLAGESINKVTYATYRVAGSAHGVHRFLFGLSFPFFAAGQSNIGFWEFFGPLITCLAPLLLLSSGKDPVRRTVLLVWLAGATLIGWTTEMLRYALPVFPIALACCIAGVGLIANRGWRAVNWAARLTIAAFLLMGFGGLCLYARPAWSVAAGLTSRESYLRQRAPDYEKCEFLNQQLAGKGSAGKVLVFFRHVYYLRVPFAYGDPESSWAVDPARLQTGSAWLRLFRENRIRWVARDASFPRSIAASLQRLESEKILVPCASTVVENWHGNRIGGTRERQTFTLYCVQP